MGEVPTTVPYEDLITIFEPEPEEEGGLWLQTNFIALTDKAVADASRIGALEQAGSDARITDLEQSQAAQDVILGTHTSQIGTLTGRVDALEAGGGGGGLVQQGATSGAVYTDLLPDGIDETNLGLNSVGIVADSPGAAATGNTRFRDGGGSLSNAVDGETLVIGDGVNTVTFEFDDDATVAPGNTPVTIGGSWNTTRLNLDAAINGSVLTISSSFGGLTHDNPGSEGNVLITSKHVVEIIVGSEIDGATVVLGDGSLTRRFEFDDDASLFEGTSTAVTIGATPTDSRDNLRAAIDASALDVTTRDSGTTGIIVLLNTAVVPKVKGFTRWSGKITCTGCADGDTVTIETDDTFDDDFFIEKVFEFDDDGIVGVGNIAVTLAGTDNGDAANLRAAIHSYWGSGFNFPYNSKVVGNVVTLQHDRELDSFVGFLDGTGGVTVAGLRSPSINSRRDFSWSGMDGGYHAIVDAASPRGSVYGYNSAVVNSPDGVAVGGNCRVFNANGFQGPSVAAGFDNQVWSSGCNIFGSDCYIGPDAEQSTLIATGGVILDGAFDSVGIGYFVNNDFPRSFALGGGGVAWQDSIAVGESVFAGFNALCLGHDSQIIDYNLSIGNRISMFGGHQNVGIGPQDPAVINRPGFNKAFDVGVDGNGNVGIGAAVQVEGDYITAVGHWSSANFPADHSSLLGARCYIDGHERALLLGADLDSEADDQASMAADKLKLIPQGRTGNGGAIVMAERVVEDITIPQGQGTAGVASATTLAKKGLIFGATARVVTPDVAGATTVDAGITGLGTAAALIDDLDAATGGATKETFGGNDGTAMPVTNSSDKTVTLTTDVNVAVAGGMVVRVEMWFMSLVAPAA
jgi:hypothetical protein